VASTSASLYCAVVVVVEVFVKNLGYQIFDIDIPMVAISVTPKRLGSSQNEAFEGLIQTI
jgi:hypothetical protein